MDEKVLEVLDILHKDIVELKDGQRDTNQRLDRIEKIGFGCGSGSRLNRI